MLRCAHSTDAPHARSQVLSRAFRNRFLELHVGDIPDEELTTILQCRCQARLSLRCAALCSAQARGVRRGDEDTFFPRMNDSDSTKAV